jgi:ketosteroid isomerase-like protein
MSQENVEVVREAWKAFADRGIDGAAEYYAEGCIGEDVPELPDHGTYVGKEGLWQRYRNFTEMWGDLVWEPVEFLDADGDVVVAVIAMRAHGRGSDAPVEIQAAFVYEVRDGKIVRDRAFTSESQALEAAGLSE